MIYIMHGLCGPKEGGAFMVNDIFGLENFNLLHVVLLVVL